MTRPSPLAAPQNWLLLLLSLLGLHCAHLPTIQVVDVIPRSLSGESNCDAEPSIAVNPANPLQMAASALTPDPLESSEAPIFVSTDGGMTWLLNVVLPGVLPGGSAMCDITLRFSQTSGVLYAGILRNDNKKVDLLRQVNLLAPGAMTDLIQIQDGDQPDVEEATALNPGVDRVYVGYNNLDAPYYRSAAVEQSLDAAKAPPLDNFVGPLSLDARTLGCMDGTSIRPAIHPNGTVYLAFLHPRSCIPPAIADVIVVRDDAWGAASNPYQAISAGGVPGVCAACAVAISLPNLYLGTQRVRGNLALAVDPRRGKSKILYIAWADGTTADTFTLHLRSSYDGGARWSHDLRQVVAATNPALAVNNLGQVGFLYQKLTGTPGSHYWETHIEISDNRFATAPAVHEMLANTQDVPGSCQGNNTLGDYDHLIAVGKDFYGIFSAYNNPDPTKIPKHVKVRYLRNVDWKRHVLTDLAGYPVQPSIDPFFFVVREP